MKAEQAGSGGLERPESGTTAERAIDTRKAPLLRRVARWAFHPTEETIRMFSRPALRGLTARPAFHDGEVLNVAVADIPERRQDLVDGRCSVTRPEGRTRPIAVRITDMLGGEALVVERTAGQDAVVASERGATGRSS